MFRDDVFTLRRPVKTLVEGEAVWSDTLIADNVPCHLSIKAISPLEQTQSTAKVLYDYILFYDRDLNISINANDIIEVTRQGKQYKLRAGESVPYPLTVQTHCEVLDIV